MNVTSITVNVDDVALTALTSEALILGVPAGGGPLTGRLAEADAATGGAIATVLAGRHFKGKPDQVQTLYPVRGLGAVERIVLFGLGDAELGAEAWRVAVAGAVCELAGQVASASLLLPAGLDVELAAEGAAESALLSLYEFHPYRTENDPDTVRFERLTLLGQGGAAAAERGVAMARVVAWVRDLSNRPGNMLTVPQLVAEATEMAKPLGLEAKVIEGPALAEQGFGLIHGVGKGSESPPAFVVLEYKGAQADEAPIVLVGKGITFDTGGVCIKPRAGMEEMKTDMHGAATVMGVLKVAAERKLPFNLVGLLAIAENMPEANAYKPGDILTSYGGLTVEIIDTDAEGRLALADSISYAVKHYEPKAVIDLATLTGSIITALGYEATGLFTNRQGLADSLKAAGEVTGERCWQFPTWEAYEAQIKSDIADLRNSGRGKGDAIHAAVFLKQFAKDVPWVHLDIAGTSWIMEDKPYRPKGSTGVGVRLLTRWLTDGARV